MTDSFAINRQITKYQSLERIAPSPLFRNKIRKIIDLYQRAAAAPGSEGLLENAETSSSEFDDGWVQLHIHLDRLELVRKTVIMVSEFLFYKLLEDYLDRPYSLYDSMLGCIDAIIKQIRCSSDSKPSSTSGTGTGGNATQAVGFTFQLEQMDLNMPYLMERKFLTVAARRGNPHNDVKSFIENHDWPQLAAALVNDRAIATTVTEEMPYYKKLFEIILKRINSMQTTYFSELCSPIDYVVRKDRHSQENSRSIFSTMSEGLFRGLPRLGASPVLQDYSTSTDLKKLN